MKKITEQNALWATVLLITVTTLARLILAAFTGLGTGESYYFRGARELDLSYFDQPPLFFWLSGITIRLFGENNFALRLPAVLLFAGTCWLLFLVAKRMFSARAGFYAVLAMNLSAVFTIAIGLWFQPDAPLMFFWMATTYGVVRIYFPDTNVSTEQWHKSAEVWKWWIFVGVMMGLTTLSKYHVAFLVAGVFLFTLMHRDQRHWLRHPGPYVAILINLILSLPIFIWNAQNDWVSFAFQGGRATGGGAFTLHFDWFLRSIGGQALWLLPWIWVPLIIQFYRSYQKRNTDVRYSFFFWTSVLPLVFFTVVTLWNNLQFHFHWQAPGYMMLFIPLGHAIAEALSEEGKWWKLTQRWVVISSFFTVTSITLLGFHMTTGFWTLYGPKWFAGKFGEKYDPTMDGNDYVDLRARFEKEGWMNDTNVVVGAPRWWLAGKVDWALHAQKPILVFNSDPRNLAFAIDPNTLLGKDVILVGRNHASDFEWSAKPFFDEIIPLQDVILYRSGVPEMVLQVYYAKNFKVPTESREEFPLYRQLTGRKPF